MKLITVQYDDTVDMSVLPIGTPNITVTDGTTSVAGGRILALSEVEDPPDPEVPATVYNVHGHPQAPQNPSGPPSPQA